MEEFKVLITTSGIGSRLGELTKYTNKSLIRIGKKPAISYIVESYPKQTEFVITVGYYASHVVDFLTLAYPDRNFTFIYASNYSDEGSSLGFSMLQAKEELQCPFIFHASDTIIEGDIKYDVDSNWVGYSQKSDTSQYRTIKTDGGFKINDKGELNNDNAYIGLAGIKDYELFWDSLEFSYNEDKLDSSLSDCHAINLMSKLTKINTKKFSGWFDMGNSSELSHAREFIHDKFEILDKVDESIFIFDDFVIKFFYNKLVCQNRIERASLLKHIAPEIIGYTDNFYKYKFAEGELLSEVVNESIFKDLLKWSKKNLWVNSETDENYIDICKNFYINKTIERVNKFLTHHKLEDKSNIINGVTVPPVMEMIKILSDTGILNTSTFNDYHGDFVLDNLLYNNGEFIALDWRQDFGGLIAKGDIKYDLAKLNHNLIFNHSLVHRKLFNVNIDGDNVKCDILCSKNLLECQKILHEFIISNDIDLRNINILTAIIWLNMSALHDDNIGEFLYYFGKLNLFKALNYEERKY